MKKSKKKLAKKKSIFKYTLTALLIICTISIALVAAINWTIDGIINLSTPINNTEIFELVTQNEQEFTGNASTEGEGLVNISLYHNFGSSWVLNQTTPENISLSTILNQTSDVTFADQGNAPFHRAQFIVNGSFGSVDLSVRAVQVIQGTGVGSSLASSVNLSTAADTSTVLGTAQFVGIGPGAESWATFTTPIQLEPDVRYEVRFFNNSGTARVQFSDGLDDIVKEDNYISFAEAAGRYAGLVALEVGPPNSTDSYNWSFNTSINFGGPFFWSVEGCATDGTCGFAINGNFTIYNNLSILSETFTASPFETDSERYELNISSSRVVSSVILVWNNTINTATLVSNAPNYSASVVFDVPLVNTTIPFTWNITYADGGVNETAEQNQSVNAINLSLMRAGQTIPYINFTFKNETTAEESVTAAIPRTSFVYFLGTGSINRTLSFTSATEFNNYTLAFTPPDRTLNVSIDLDYDNSLSQQRTFNPQTLFSLSNTTTEQVLFLLPTNDGIFVTFQVINLAQQPIEDVNVRLEKSGTLISETQTGASGTTNVFLNPNTPYLLNVTKTGFSEFSTTQTFPTSEFTIILGTAQGSTNTSFSQGVTFSITPPPRLLENNTDYNFTFKVNSTLFSLQEFGFDLVNSSGGLIGRNFTAGSNFGTVILTNNTGLNRQIIMEYYWKTNDTYVNGTTSWGIDEFTDGSIIGFVKRFKVYLDNGIFGSTKFTKVLIIFFVIFLTTGILSFKFGLRAPEAILTIGVLTIALFDIGFGLLDFGFPGAIPNAATWFSMLVLIAVWLRRVA